MTESDPIYSYSNDQAIEDGMLADVTPDSMKGQGWQWIVTPGVIEKSFSPAAYAELFNQIVEAYNAQKEINPLVSTMNDQTLWLFLEGDDKKKVFKAILPEEY